MIDDDRCSERVAVTEERVCGAVNGETGAEGRKEEEWRWAANWGVYPGDVRERASAEHAAHTRERRSCRIPRGGGVVMLAGE